MDASNQHSDQFAGTQNQEFDKKMDDYEQNNQTDLYHVLGLEQDATQEEIKQKYNELLLLYHPDKGGDPQKFKDLKIAYKILSDPSSRDVYNKSLSSTYDDITKQYRDESGKHVDLGYQKHENDFAKKTLNDEQKQAQKDEFMNKFDQLRTDEEKQLLKDMKKTIDS